MKKISEMKSCELGQYVGDIAIKIREENPHLSNAELIELALKQVVSEAMEQEATE